MKASHCELRSKNVLHRDMKSERSPGGWNTSFWACMSTDWRQELSFFTKKKPGFWVKLSSPNQTSSWKNRELQWYPEGWFHHRPTSTQLEGNRCNECWDIWNKSPYAFSDSKLKLGPTQQNQTEPVVTLLELKEKEIISYNLWKKPNQTA